MVLSAKYRVVPAHRNWHWQIETAVWNLAGFLHCAWVRGKRRSFSPLQSARVERIHIENLFFHKIPGWNPLAAIWAVSQWFSWWFSQWCSLWKSYFSLWKIFMIFCMIFLMVHKISYHKVRVSFWKRRGEPDQPIFFGDQICLSKLSRKANLTLANLFTFRSIVNLFTFRRFNPKK